MIIIVQNHRINTDDIYEITPVVCESWYYSRIEVKFRILRFNVTPMEVSIKMGVSEIKDLTGFYPLDHKFTYEQIEEASEILKNKLQKLQDEIIAVWSNNQKEIPTFNL